MRKLLLIIVLATISTLCNSQAWPKLYGDNLNSRARKVIETYDKGYVIGSTIDVG